MSVGRIRRCSKIVSVPDFACGTSSFPGPLGPGFFYAPSPGSYGSTLSISIFIFIGVGLQLAVDFLSAIGLVLTEMLEEATAPLEQAIAPEYVDHLLIAFASFSLRHVQRSFDGAGDGVHIVGVDP